MANLKQRVEALETATGRRATYEEILFSILDELPLATKHHPVTDQQLDAIFPLIPNEQELHHAKP